MNRVSKYFSDVWSGFWTTIVGLGITLPKLIQKPVTIQYPEEAYKLPERSRQRLDLNLDDCIGCDQCAKICPVDCITIETSKAPTGTDYGKTSEKSGGKTKRLKVGRFDIDMSLCCYCGLCTEVCPTSCLTMTPSYEFSVYDTKDFVYKFVQGIKNMPPKTHLDPNRKMIDSYELWKEQIKPAPVAAAPAATAAPQATTKN